LREEIVQRGYSETRVGVSRKHARQVAFFSRKNHLEDFHEGHVYSGFALGEDESVMKITSSKDKSV
jgi:hypothetical protein